MKFLFRYIDAVLYLFIGFDGQLFYFVNVLNSYDNNIKFAMDTKVTKPINIVNLTIDHNANKFNLKVVEF